MYFGFNEPERSTGNVQGGFNQPCPARYPEAYPIHNFPQTQSLPSSDYRVLSAHANNYQHHQVSSASNGPYRPPAPASLQTPSSSRADFPTAGLKPKESHPQPTNRMVQPARKPPKRRKRPVVQHPFPARFDKPDTDVCCVPSANHAASDTLDVTSAHHAPNARVLSKPTTAFTTQ